jgi:hypothetical protein
MKDFITAEVKLRLARIKITTLLKEGLISIDEFNQIMEQLAITFAMQKDSPKSSGKSRF